MAETPEYFDNIVLGQYSMTGVPLKVYANDRYYIIPSPEDVDDPLIGYGMTGAGKMEPFDYRDIEHIMVSGNKVDLATYVKALGDELKGVAKAAAEKPAGGEKKEGGEEEKKEEEGGGTNPFESFDPYSKKWSLKALVELSKDEFKAQQDALKAEMEAGKAKIKAAKDKMSDLKKQPIEDGVINDPIVESVISDILIIASESTTYEKFISELIKQKLLKREDLRDPELVDELKTMYRGQALGKRESVNEYKMFSPKMINSIDIGHKIITNRGTYIITDFGRKSNATREFAAKDKTGKPFNLRFSLRGTTGVSVAAGSMNLNFPEQEEMIKNISENYISEPYVFQVGDVIRNTNPQCKHFGSTGIVQSVMDMDDNVGQLIKYLVTNYGDTFKPGMSLTKTPDQLTPVDSNHNDWDDWDDADDGHDWDEWETHHDGHDDEDEWEEYDIEYGDDWDDEDED